MATMSSKSTRAPQATAIPSATKKVPAVLATPTDLKAADVAEITKAVNALVADAFALYLKTKNFHWHVSGIHFRDLHLLFDEQAAQILASIDPLAERVRRLGGLTLHSVAEVGRLQSIVDDHDVLVSAHDMVERLMADNQHMAHAMRQAHGLCDGAKDVATASILEELIDQAEKRVWFLFEAMQGLAADRSR